MSLAAKKAELKSIYDQAVAEGDIETANAAADRAAALTEEPKLSIAQEASMGLPEAVTNMASGMLAGPAGNIAGLGAIGLDLLSGGEGKYDPEAVRRGVREALTYQPRSETGKVIAAYNPLALLGQGIHYGAKNLGDLAYGATGSKRAQQLVTDITPELLTIAGAKYPISSVPLAKTAGKVLSFVPESAANVIRPHTNPRLSAGLLMNKVAGSRKDAILNALDKSAESMPRAPGVRQETGLSAGQAAVPAGSAEFSALQRAADQIDPSYAVARDAAQELRRDLNLQQVQPELAAAEAVRESAAGPLYRLAERQHATITPSMNNILQSLPSGVISKAQNTARIAQMPFTQGTHVPAHTASSPYTGLKINVPEQFPTISGWNLHNIKTGVSDALSNPNLKGTAEGVSNQSLGDFLQQFETQIPVYGAARQVFREKSVPVNQSKVIQKARDILSGQGGTERMGPYMNITGRGETSFMKSATGYPNAGTIDTVVNPTQMAALDEVGRQLIRDKDLADLQNAGAPSVARAVGEFGKPVDIPTLWNQTATIIKSALGKFESHGRDITMKEVTKVMKDPVLSAKVMRQATPQQKALLARIMNEQATGMIGAQLSTQNQDDK